MNNKWLLAAAVAALILPSEAMAKDDSSRHGRYKDHIMEKVDANKDGKISKDEFLAAHAAKFDEMDTNKDGFLSEEERKAKREEHRSRMKDRAE